MPSAIASASELVGAFLAISRYLRSISLNEYTGAESHENRELDKLLSALSRYSFKGSEDVYSIHLRPRPKKKTTGKARQRSGRSSHPQSSPALSL